MPAICGIETGKCPETEPIKTLLGISVNRMVSNVLKSIKISREMPPSGNIYRHNWF